jgi:pimeloyl-ACP methyl ester carboxylesterase
VVLLVGGAESTGRDELTAGIPLFGQIAGGLADAGYLVMRYDKRGAGRTGGRVESATLADYADDAVSIVKSLAVRRDVDPDRIAVIGYAEGASIALAAASEEKRISALGMLAGSGQAGRYLVMEQQAHVLARSNEPDTSKREKTALQRQIVNAVINGSGWDGVPAAIQRQTDTPWFRSWLLFDPSPVISKINQPVLILTGAIDTEMPPSEADRLSQSAHVRKKPEQSARKVIVPGVNHLLVAATTGETDEYPSLAGSTVSPAVISALVSWLGDELRPRK